MQEQFQEQERQKMIKTRSILDWIRGGFFFLAGIFFITYRYSNIRILAREPANIDFVFGGVLVVYGIWRMYKGYKKDYFK
jgi:hypothetical protein